VSGGVYKLVFPKVLFTGEELEALKALEGSETQVTDLDVALAVESGTECLGTVWVLARQFHYLFISYRNHKANPFLFNRSIRVLPF
jgi:hypothetical protein